MKLNADPLKAPAYHDTSVQLKKKYFYSVAAIDERNNQSAPSEAASKDHKEKCRRERDARAYIFLYGTCSLASSDGALWLLRSSMAATE